MVKINAFKGITYNKNKLNLDSTLYAPPYDVINPSFQDDLYSRSDYNIVRLILGKAYDSDNDNNNKYTRAADDMKKWLAEGVLVESDVPKLYYYVQEYKDHKGENITRKGFFSRCYLEDFSSKKILPHEETMGGPKKDRLSLTQACEANMESIFNIYFDPEKEVDSVLGSACPSEPFVDVIDDDGIRHILYEITDTEAISKVKSLMDDKSVLIADGHHRYETALKNRDLQREAGNTDTSEDIPHNSLLVYFANFDDDGLRVYPTHRVLKKVVDLPFEKVKEKLKLYFNFNEYSFNNFDECFGLIEKNKPEDIFISLVNKEDTGKLYIITPIMEKILPLLDENDVPEILAKLDVTILHRFILETIMNLDTIELKNQSNIQFIRDEDELVDLYNNEESEYVFLLSAPDVPLVKEICMSGHRMPQKSTYFYPKILSGLVINPLK